MFPRTGKPHLPPDLQELCAILAAGLVRLHRHTAEQLARDSAPVPDQGDSSLHFPPNQSGHAKPKQRSLA